MTTQAQPQTPAQYRLLDSGRGEKLEQAGPYRLIRPAPQALWARQRPAREWAVAEAHYHRSSSGGGQWEFRCPLPPEWVLVVHGLRLKVRLTDFGHLGLFPEHRDAWVWLEQVLAAARTETPPRVLNTFAYTGGATLVAARSGARVTHLDAARGMVTWARENAELNQLHNAPLRWMVEDVSRFLAGTAPGQSV